MAAAVAAARPVWRIDKKSNTFTLAWLGLADRAETVAPSPPHSTPAATRPEPSPRRARRRPHALPRAPLARSLARRNGISPPFAAAAASSPSLLPALPSSTSSLRPPATRRQVSLPPNPSCQPTRRPDTRRKSDGFFKSTCGAFARSLARSLARLLFRYLTRRAAVASKGAALPLDSFAQPHGPTGEKRRSETEGGCRVLSHHLVGLARCAPSKTLAELGL